MSLIVWLPLSGDLHNQGLSDLTVTNNGAIVNDNGKIGKCYQFNTSGSDISLKSSVMTSFTTECSVSFWLNILTWNASYATYFQAGLASTPWTSYIFGFLRNGANSTCCFTISNGSSATNASFLTPAFDLNKWYHIGLVYKTGHCLIYINGSLYKDYTTTIVPNFAGIKAIRLGRSANGSSYQTNCLMNDFRIYDHALSAAEVKEIAQGLVLHYKLDDLNNTKIHDSSGYGHDGTIVGELAVTVNTPRYNSATSFNSSSYISDIAPLISESTNYRNELTVSAWLYRDGTNTEFSDIYGGPIEFHLHTDGQTIRMQWYHAKEDESSYSRNIWAPGVIIPLQQWTHVCCTYKDGVMRLYINGENTNTSDRSNTGTKIRGNNTSNHRVGYRINGSLSDFRVYTTALAPEDVLQLYQTGMKIDKGNNIHPFEIEEFDENKLLKTGVLKTMASELEGSSYLKYDNKLYIEPDGSCWVRVFHHNNPAGGAFASGDPFATSVYKDANRWFNFELANHINKWEIMVKQKATASDDEVKYRWVQTVNPMSATFAQVAAANITKVTTSGYTNFSTGGLYKIDNTNTYLCTNNGTNGNWWGAMGTYVIYQGGTPAWSGKLVTTGYIDTFLRIDNLENSHSLKVKSTKNNLWLANQFIER